MSAQRGARELHSNVEELRGGGYGARALALGGRSGSLPQDAARHVRLRLFPFAQGHHIARSAPSPPPGLLGDLSSEVAATAPAFSLEDVLHPVRRSRDDRLGGPRAGGGHSRFLW